MKALIQRTEMIGGGTSYDVYISFDQLKYKPSYRTIPASRPIMEEHGKTIDAYLPADFDSLPACSDIRWNTYKEAERKAEAKELEIAQQAFSELAALEKMPLLWCHWTLPSETKTIEFEP